jgi:hypothetical protein
MDAFIHELMELGQRSMKAGKLVGDVTGRSNNSNKILTK